MVLVSLKQTVSVNTDKIYKWPQADIDGWILGCDAGNYWGVHLRTISPQLLSMKSSLPDACLSALPDQIDLLKLTSVKHAGRSAFPSSADGHIKERLVYRARLVSG